MLTERAERIALDISTQAFVAKMGHCDLRVDKEGGEKAGDFFVSIYKKVKEALDQENV